MKPKVIKSPGVRQPTQTDAQRLDELQKAGCMSGTQLIEMIKLHRVVKGPVNIVTLPSDFGKK